MNRSMTSWTVAVIALTLAACSSTPTEITTASEDIDAASVRAEVTVTEPDLPDASDAAPQEPDPTIAPPDPREFTTEVLPMCADLPDLAPADDEDFSEAELIALANQVWATVGIEYGLQGAGIGRENRVGLEYVDPPLEGFEERLAELPDGYCVEYVAFTPEPPERLGVIDDYGEVSALPEGVERVVVMFPTISGPPTPDAMEFTLWLSEQSCASGREMGDRLLPLEVYESPDEILIAAGVVVQLTGQNCPGNPPTAVTVKLDEPVGDRAILNAFSGYPIRTSPE